MQTTNQEVIKTETLSGHTFTYLLVKEEKVSTKGMHYINDACPVCQDMGLYVYQVNDKWVRYCTFCEVHHTISSDWKYEGRR